MITPTCNKCNEELTEFGGILLSPPNELDKVHKYHLCAGCCSAIEKDLQ